MSQALPVETRGGSVTRKFVPVTMTAVLVALEKQDKPNAPALRPGGNTPDV